MNKEIIINKLQKLPRILVGSLAWDHKDKGINLRDSCVSMIEEVIKTSNPKEILEIGTHLGHSSCLFLSISQANVTSVDIGHNWVEWEHGYDDWHTPRQGGGLKDVVSTLSNEFPNRFRFIIGGSTSPETINKFSDRKYDLIFIDGDHSYDFVKKDIKTAIDLKIPYILLDDFTDHDSPCRVAAQELDLIFLKEYKNIHNDGNISCGFFKNPFLNV